MVKPFISEENSHLVWILLLPRSIQQDGLWFLWFSSEIEVKSKDSGGWSREMILWFLKSYWGDDSVLKERYSCYDTEEGEVVIFEKFSPPDTLLF
jgi:hypothetical protein